LRVVVEGSLDDFVEVLNPVARMLEYEIVLAREVAVHSATRSASGDGDGFQGDGVEASDRRNHAWTALGALRMKAPSIRNLATAHVETLLQAVMQLGLAFAVGNVCERRLSG
jgi:hypothetical protein